MEFKANPKLDAALSALENDMIDAILAQHVKVNDGTIFGKEGDGFIRLNIACPRAQLEAALAAMAKVLA